MTAGARATGRSLAPAGTGIPKIRLLSRPGAESVLWGLVIAHLVKWAVSFGYFASWQVKYPGPLYGDARPYLAWYGKDFWDRFVIHVQNGLPGEAAAACGILAAACGALIGMGGWRRVAGRRLGTLIVTAGCCCLGVLTALLAARSLAGWHVHWFAGQDAPAWWVTWRHDIRDVGIALIGTVIVRLLFSKPKYPAGDNPGLKAYVTRVPLAIAAALVPIAAVGILAWKLPWLLRHGWHVPARYGPLAAEVNGWVAAGTWITVVMGILGGLVAGRVIQRVADDVQWFFAGRSAGKAAHWRDGPLRHAVTGTPSHRLRVHWLLDNDPGLPERSPWLVRLLLAVAVVSLLFSGAGAWLNLAGPAAH